MAFTAEELEAMRLADEEIEAEFLWIGAVTAEERALSLALDKAAIFDRLDHEAAAKKRRIAAYQAAYRAEHKEEIAAKAAAYYAEHKEEIAAYQAAYRAKNREAYNAYMREYLRERRRKKKNEDKLEGRR